MLLDYFSQAMVGDRPLADYLRGKVAATDLSSVKKILDYIHMSQALLRVYGPDYPLIEPRELLPSFEDSFLEYSQLPKFSLLVLDRALDYQAERFQFDLLQTDEPGEGITLSAPRVPSAAFNKNLFKSRLPREFHLDFDLRLEDKELTALSDYPAVLEFIFHMDRAHIIARDESGDFRLLGLFASFPSNLDAAIKSFGRRIGKFKSKDNRLYHENRLMIYQFLMELYGFPISSERRTSAAIFTRDLSRHRERFLVKVLGQTDRVITSLYHPVGKDRYPELEKVALVPLNIKSKALIRKLENEGYFVDPERQVVLLRAIYQQHRYNKHNVIEERALSLEDQEIIHPRTGERFPWFNVLQAREDRLVRLNDIVRGEYSGRIVFQGQEVVEGTVKHEDRLKFLLAWLSKHQRRLVASSPAYLEKMEKIVNSYILNLEMEPHFRSHRDLHKKIIAQMAYIEQAHAVHRLERLFSGKSRVKYLDLLDALLNFLLKNQHVIPGYYEPVFEKLVFLCDKVLKDRYILKKYIDNTPQTEYGRKVAAVYQELSGLKSMVEKEYYAEHGSKNVLWT
ncbi:MAG: hypothetical protein JRI95_06615 [Deltaproteobacteria bacterium]|nr:hypothetical protein [Deltaproteobacteria bacterium]MBW2085303.1 hypothetical protein [Deltaproteobacteria bacterium]